MAASRGRAGTPSSPALRPSASRDPGHVVTMRDIADAAGLNGAPTNVPIALETRERITRTALGLGYRPNPLARALRGAPTMLLGAVVRDFSDPFFAGALEVLAAEAIARGYNILLGHVQGREFEGLGLTAILEPRHCDAVLILGDMQDQPRLLADLRDANGPVVALWQGRSPVRFPTVDVDDRAGTAIGLEHLFQLGHERIGFVSASLPGDNPTREEAFIECMTARFGSVPNGYVQRCESTMAGGEAAIKALLGLPEPPTAIACSNDLAAVGVLHGAHSLGVLVPDRGRVRRPDVRAVSRARADHPADAHDRDRHRSRQDHHGADSRPRSLARSTEDGLRADPGGARVHRACVVRREGGRADRLTRAASRPTTARTTRVPSRGPHHGR
jgi:DNA-binding LacI/PurR family transcriptional regulator